MLHSRAFVWSNKKHTETRIALEQQDRKVLSSHDIRVLEVVVPPSVTTSVLPGLIWSRWTRCLPWMWSASNAGKSLSTRSIAHDPMCCWHV